MFLQRLSNLRSFSTAVYLWKPPSTLGVKGGGNVKEKLMMPTMP
jgi:alpha-tubulin suppressor-like RCC1 family protein